MTRRNSYGRETRRGQPFRWFFRPSVVTVSVLGVTSSLYIIFINYTDNDGMDTDAEDTDVSIGHQRF